MIDIKLVEFLNNNEMSAEEFILLYLIHKDKTDDTGEVNKKFEQYVNNNAGKFNYKELFIELENKDLLTNLNKFNEYYLEKLKVSDKFIELLFVDKDTAFQEIVAIYPKKMEIKQHRDEKAKIYPTFGNPVIEANLYHQFIEGRRDKHIRFKYILEEYVEMNSGKAPYKFESLLNNFESIALLVEDGYKKDDEDFEILI